MASAIMARLASSNTLLRSEPVLGKSVDAGVAVGTTLGTGVGVVATGVLVGAAVAVGVGVALDKSAIEPILVSAKAGRIGRARLDARVRPITIKDMRMGS
jgi:hypothetical protein